MATIFRTGRFRVVIYSKDHRPPHVHVIGTGNAAKIALGEPGRNPFLVANDGLSRKQLATVLREIEEKQTLLLQRWRDIHGDA